MPLVRCCAGITFAVVALALAADPAAVAQDLPQKKNPDWDTVRKHRRSNESINTQELPGAKKAFAAVAAYHAELISSPIIYRATQDFRPDAKVPTFDKITDELNELILVPELGSRNGREQTKYIYEFGSALDAALKPVIEKTDGERIVRVNAARLLAVAARSGAPDHYPTVTKLVTDPAIPGEVRFYVLKAAEGLLAAYDSNRYEKEPGTYKGREHSTTPTQVVALVTALEAAINTPSVLIPGLPPAAKLGDLSIDDRAAVQYLRRQAVRALAQCRFASVAAEQTVYPAYTLARIAVGDPVLVPPSVGIRPQPPELTQEAEIKVWLTQDAEVKGWARHEATRLSTERSRRAAEAAEAVIGLCNMSPTTGYDLEQAAGVVATGLLTFVTPRVSSTQDRSLPWKTSAARLSDALLAWQLISAPKFDLLRADKIDANAAPESVKSVVRAAIVIRKDSMGTLTRFGMLADIERGSTDAVSATPLADALKKLPPGGGPLFKDEPKTSLNFGAGKP